jgi:hypothetical protein
VRLIALALLVMVPSLSFAHGLGPADDAPVVERAPSARLLPSATPAPAVTPEAPGPLYARGWFWSLLGMASAGTVAAIVMGAVMFLFSQVHPLTSPPVARCPAGKTCAMPL